MPTLRVVLFVLLTAVYVIFFLPNIARMWYLAWFDVEGFHAAEVKRIEKLYEEQPAKSRTPKEEWLTRVQRSPWLWYHRVVSSVGLLVFLAVLALFALELLGVVPSTVLG